MKTMADLYRSEKSLHCQQAGNNPQRLYVFTSVKLCRLNVFMLSD